MAELEAGLDEEDAMTDLTPTELAALRERAEKALVFTQSPWDAGEDPETVLRLVAMAERSAELADERDGLACDLHHAEEMVERGKLREQDCTNALAALNKVIADQRDENREEQKRSARYRDALRRIEHGWDTAAANATYRHGYYTAGGLASDIARAALEEPEEAQP